jgi:hypothetical protein
MAIASEFADREIERSKLLSFKRHQISQMATLKPPTFTAFGILARFYIGELRLKRAHHPLSGPVRYAKPILNII